MAILRRYNDRVNNRRTGYLGGAKWQALLYAFLSALIKLHLMRFSAILIAPLVLQVKRNTKQKYIRRFITLLGTDEV